MCRHNYPNALAAGGDVGFEELLTLGQTRRKLGQRGGAWTDAMNENLMNRIGTDSRGSIPEHNFAKYFNETLPSDREAFEVSYCSVHLSKQGSVLCRASRNPVAY